ncbi:glycine cleavage system protein GcvH [Kitasatospora sp. NPDC059327]|uniref:glycine cleavage system protein GcvH n=1 Tax=Kitasatospora sp. NPDC059327 TaxID=3346803 RepID=UPI0036B82A20
MANIPSDLSYTDDHEWVRSVAGGRLRVGITDHAQKQLGDIVYVELPKKGDVFEQGRPFGSVESVKSVSELYLPLGGTVSAVNEELNDSPEQINDDPYGDGWMIEITPAAGADLTDLLTADRYAALLKEGTSD